MFYNQLCSHILNYSYFYNLYLQFRLSHSIKNMLFSFTFQLKAKIKVEFGKAGETIHRIAEQQKVSFIVMGGRGLSTLRRALLGGVSDYVIKHTQIPVVFVPGQH